MTGMEHAIEQAARIIHGCTGDEDGAPVAARALADAGLLTPAPPRESGVGWYEVIHPSRATTHIAYVHEDGSIYFPEGDYPLSEHEFAFAAATGRAHRLVRRPVHDWMPVNPDCGLTAHGKVPVSKIKLEEKQ